MYDTNKNGKIDKKGENLKLKSSIKFWLFLFYFRNGENYNGNIRFIRYLYWTLAFWLFIKLQEKISKGKQIEKMKMIPRTEPKLFLSKIFAFLVWRKILILIMFLI